jgi:hypothetical protein
LCNFLSSWKPLDGVILPDWFLSLHTKSLFTLWSTKESGLGWISS